MKKTLFFVAIFLFAFITKVDALTSSIDCPNKNFIKNDLFSCQVMVTPEEGDTITSFKTGIEYSDNDLELVSITPTTNWESNSNNSIDLVNSTYEEGQGLSETTIAILNFKIKTTTTYGNKTISINGDDVSSVKSDSINIVSTNNLLSSLTISGASFTFNSSQKDYTIKGITTSSITISATLGDERAHFDSNYKPGVYNLKYGNNTIQIVVISESGKANTYTLNINRTDSRSSNNNLSELSISQGILTPVFNKNTLVYDVAVATTVESVIIDASLENNKAEFVYEYGPRTVQLINGNNSILIQVKSEKGETKTYTINVTKSDKKSNNYLKNIKLSNGEIDFNKDISEYKLNVLYETEKFEVTAEVEDMSSKVEVIGNKNLSVGENIYTIQVTAENGSIRTYTVLVTRLEEGKKLSSDATLKELVVKNYPFDFNKDVYKYKLNIKQEDRLSISYTASNENAIVKVIGNNNLKNGNTISIVVTSEDKTTKTYEIEIQKSINWSIILLIVGGIILTTGIVLLIVFKDKIFKLKDKVIESDVLTGKRLVLGNNSDNEKTKIFDKKPELTVIPDIPDELEEEPDIYQENKNE